MAGGAGCRSGRFDVADGDGGEGLPDGVRLLRRRGAGLSGYANRGRAGARSGARGAASGGAEQGSSFPSNVVYLLVISW